MSITRDTPTNVVVLDHVGLLAITDGTAHYVTRCCRAAVTGSGSGPWIECKGCHKRVYQDGMADSWEVTDTSRWMRWVHDIIADAYRAHPNNVRSGVIESMTASVLRQVGVLVTP